MVEVCVGKARGMPSIGGAAWVVARAWKVVGEVGCQPVPTVTHLSTNNLV